MNRRRMLLLGTAAALAKPRNTHGQDPASDALQRILEDAVVEAAFRSFRAIDASRAGALALSAAVVVFESSDFAEVGLEPVFDAIVGGTERAGTVLVAATPPPIGDESIAASGALESADGGGLTAGAVGFRDGATVVVIVVVGRGEALTDAVATAERVEGRRPGFAATPVMNGGARTDGAFALLPSEVDVPHGLVLDGEDAYP